MHLYFCQFAATRLIKSALTERKKKLENATKHLQGENKNQCNGSSLAKIKINASISCVPDFQLW